MSPLANYMTGLGGALGGYGQQAQQQASLLYNASSNIWQGAVTATPAASYISTVTYEAQSRDFAQDRPLTNTEWLDRRVNEMRIRL